MGVEPRFMNLNPAKIENAIKNKITDIMPVHVYGNPYLVDEIQRIPDKLVFMLPKCLAQLNEVLLTVILHK